MMRWVLLLLLTVAFAEVGVGIASGCKLLCYRALSEFHVDAALILYLLTETLATTLDWANISDLKLTESYR